MAQARYLVRFDDICPAMDWGTWDAVEDALVSEGVRPIVAVVPDNRDEHLMFGDADADFWSKVRAWQSMGWSIAIHGYQHLYETRDAGILGLNRYSEFSGLTYAEQRAKLEHALNIFYLNDIKPTLWVAPAHSFDAVTVRVLSDLGVHVISDGFFTRPVRYLNATWIPQQLWRFRSFSFGLWTVCYHINGLQPKEIEKIRNDLRVFKDSIIGVDELLESEEVNKISLKDQIISVLGIRLILLKRFLNKLSS